MSCCCRKYAAWLSRSAKIATSTFAPVTSSRPEDCTWITARWITRWNPAVGFESWRPSATRLASSVSTYSTRLRRRTSRSTLQARMTAAAAWSSGGARGGSGGVGGRGGGCGVLMGDEGEEEMLQGGVFVAAFAGQRQGAVEGL